MVNRLGGRKDSLLLGGPTAFVCAFKENAFGEEWRGGLCVRRCFEEHFGCFRVEVSSRFGEKRWGRLWFSGISVVSGMHMGVFDNV